MHDAVTLVITSCGRQDLLKRCLDSFFAFNTHPVAGAVIVEDGGAYGINDFATQYHPQVTLIYASQRIGQIKAIDLAYSLVDTPYIFHCEDDWEFHAAGFIEKSLAVLEQHQKVCQVWIRALDDTNNHPLQTLTHHAHGVPFRLLETHFRDMWHGFSFNPGLRRLSDYREIGPYSRHTIFNPARPGRSERAIGKLYQEGGFVAAILADNDGKGYVKHTGRKRHVT
jgi:hypothetical protein